MPPNPLLHRWCHLRGALAALAALSLVGCAKSPLSPDADATRLIFRMNVDGQVRSDYVYIFAIRTSTDLNPTTDGPLPVVAFPTNNGFLTGNANYFIRWTPETRQYTIYKFTDSSLSFYNAVGIPLNSIDVTTGSKTLGFEISINQLADNATDAKALQSIQVNLLTMNRLLDPSSGSSRIIDSLGNNQNISEINSFVRIPLATSQVYDNSRFSFLEPTTSDTNDPDLDIRDWSIEVRNQ